MKFSTLRGVYLLKEDRSGFDTIKLTDDVTLFMRPREGFASTNFSNCCRIVHSPENGKYSVGERVWVHHFIVDQRFKRNNKFGEEIYAREEQIFFSAEDITNFKDPDVCVFQYLSTGEHASNGVIIPASTDDNKGRVVTGCFPGGSVIEFVPNKEYEIFFNEKQYLVIDKRHVTSLDGIPYGDYYRIDAFENFEYQGNFGIIKGQLGKQLHEKISLPQKLSLALLYSPSLELDGKTAIVNTPKGKWAHSESILATL
jgi:hypothetical protein